MIRAPALRFAVGLTLLASAAAGALPGRGNVTCLANSSQPITVSLTMHGGSDRGGADHPKDPPDKSHIQTCAHPPVLSCTQVFTYKPANYDKNTSPLVVIYHGIERNAEDFRDWGIPIANATGALVAVPYYDKDRWASPQPQRRRSLLVAPRRRDCLIHPSLLRYLPNA
jgi:hypothetical protein